jgi:hypothetical protein
MPSLSDIANDIKNILNNVSVNTQQTAVTTGQIKADTAAANVKLDSINTTLQNGFALLASGLFAIQEGQKKTNSLLEANSAENKTIICWLTIMAELLCRQLRKFNEHLLMEDEIRDSLHMLTRVFELVYAREAVEAARLAETEKSIAECCPPEKPEPERCYDPCVLRPVEPYKPQGQDWWQPREKPIG